MYSDEYEILAAIQNGDLREFQDDWPPKNTLVNKECFDRLNRENLIHAPIDVSCDNGWGYMDIALNSSGILLLDKLTPEREKLSFIDKFLKFIKEHVFASVSIATLVSAGVIALIQESVKSLFK